MSFKQKIILTGILLVVVAGIIAGVMWSGPQQKPEDESSSPEGPVKISVDFPRDSYQVGEEILGDKTGHYNITPVQEEINGVFLLKFSRPGVERTEYPRKKEYQVPVTGEKRKHLKEEVRDSVSEKEFQKRLQGQVSGTLRAFQLNESDYKAYKRGFPEEGKYTYTVAFYSCSDIEEKVKSACSEALAVNIDKKVEPRVQDSATVTVSP